MSANCIDAACDQACLSAGYIGIRTATYDAAYPHAVFASMLAGEVVNYHPHEPAGKVNVIFGYDGATDTQDHAKPRVWTPNRLMLAAVVFAAGVVLWRIKRAWMRHG